MQEDVSYSIGKYVKLYERVRQRVADNTEAGHNARVNIGNMLVDLTPDYENDNIAPGSAAGAAVAGIAHITGDLLPVDVLSETEISDTESVSDGTIYTINVDAPLPQQARFRAMLEAGSGFTSLIADDYDVSDGDVLKKRPTRDTYEYKVKIKEFEAQDNEAGFGLLDITQDSEVR